MFLNLAFLAAAAVGFPAGGVSPTITIPHSLLPSVGSAKVLGKLDKDRVLYVAVGLQPQHPAELQAFCDSVSDPRSPNYRQWLTPAQVGESFGASATQVASVESYLKSKGFKITLSAPNRMAILAEGTVAEAQSAFGTTIENYEGKDPSGATIRFFANSTPLHLPTTVGGPVVSITGVENYTRPKPRATTQTLTPPLTRALYNTKPLFSGGYKGEGRSIGISNWDGFDVSNANLYITQYNLPVPSGGPGSNIHVVTISGGSQGNPAAGEGDLDFQMELGMAPLADIYIYDGGGGDLIGVLTKEASDNQCEIISESWGWALPSGTATSAHNQHLAMTAQGMTYMAASGDSGTQIEPFSYPNYDGEVLMVGGTVATVDSITGLRTDEVAWSGGGGGWSTNAATFNKKPAWQVGNGVPSGINYRLSPDIALHAAGAGGAYYFYTGGGLTTADGTSFASPINAGCLALVEQKLEANSTEDRLGRFQDAIYLMNGRSDVWHDITVGNNGTLPNGQPSNATPGWDFTTGWGSIDFNKLYDALFQEVTPVEVAPISITPVYGLYLSGDVTSVATIDGLTYDMQSLALRSLGQAAGGELAFVVPTDTVDVKVQIMAYTDAGGGTTMVWLQNLNTGNWDYMGACPIDTSGNTPRTIHIPSQGLSNYIDASGNVALRIRGHFPVRFGQGVPPPFLYRLDQVILSVHEGS